MLLTELHVYLVQNPVESDSVKRRQDNDYCQRILRRLLAAD